MLNAGTGSGFPEIHHHQLNIGETTVGQELYFRFAGTSGHTDRFNVSRETMVFATYLLNKA